MWAKRNLLLSGLVSDLAAGTVVFLVALPLCLGIALASNAPLHAGLIAGIVGGVVVGLLSGSHTSVSGPGNTLMALVAAQITALGSFESFLAAVIVAGLVQIVLGALHVGFIAAYFPSSVIKGFLAAIGVILILKQIPHVFGHDTNPQGEMAFQQPDHDNTFSAFAELLLHIHPGATLVGVTSIVLLFFWDKWSLFRKLRVPAPLAVVLLGMVLGEILRHLGGRWTIGPQHLVQVPIANTLADLPSFIQGPDVSQWLNPAVYLAGVMIAVIASLETLLNLEAIDKLDPQQRTSPPSRELLAQGIGNVVAGLLGGLPITSVIVRSSVNLNAGARTKLATISHGALLLMCVAFLPQWLNRIPLACLAAILLTTGVKLVSPALVRQLWRQGHYQFVPFAVTVVAIIFTDLLLGVVIGLVVSIGFILHSNIRRPWRRFYEKHLAGDMLHIELGSQVSFLNRAALAKALDDVPRGGHVLFDARNTDYLDPDMLELMREYKDRSAPARGVKVSLLGFRGKFAFDDQIEYVDHSTRELQSRVTPQQVLQILKDGHERFRQGRRLTRDLGRLVNATAQGQYPLAVVLSCIDSRTPTELIFDMGVGDIFCVRIAGNVPTREVLGSLEYGCAIAGAKLIVVLGHTRCGAVTAAVDPSSISAANDQAGGCPHVEQILHEIRKSIDPDVCCNAERNTGIERQAIIDKVARANVARTVRRILEQSPTLSHLAQSGQIMAVGAMYDVATGAITFLSPEPSTCVVEPHH
jgi:carbonic anhydrase